MLLEKLPEIKIRKQKIGNVVVPELLIGEEHKIHHFWIGTAMMAYGFINGNNLLKYLGLSFASHDWGAHMTTKTIKEMKRHKRSDKNDKYETSDDS